ncbi:dihydrofolate reductase family protein [Prolixibacter denitrificans]|uniref:Dihydrofolate reductase n=1 Tax=Prolixibacter denitrificans TaxID=1541063 RepID=A0A2P8CGY6_9BACT|nr:dihydrofolate reductase family protein [Prolixibacter denitrificans]PSK84240.1 dihydrofolate reductase [Prolixibacter denitrificans]GET20414.1 hypothetical protein JCM18694_06600 [Prolixibacter denitrificans]
MRKLILNIAISLDGCIEGPNGEFDWCFTDQDYGMTQFMKQIDTLLMGRKSYEVLTSSSTDPFPGKELVVFSRRLRNLEPPARLHQGNLKHTVTQLKVQPGKDIWLFGGADIAGQCLDLGLVDEMQLAVHPLFIGNGKSLFRLLNRRRNWKLSETKRFDTGLIQLFYRKDQ